jgi:hypothetical protein
MPSTNRPRGKDQQIGTFHQLQMGVAGGDAPAHRLRISARICSFRWLPVASLAA